MPSSQVVSRNSRNNSANARQKLGQLGVVKSRRVYKVLLESCILKSMPKRSLEDVFAQSPWQQKRGRACKTTSATERRKSVCAPARSSKPASVPKQRKHAESPASKTVEAARTGGREQAVREEEKMFDRCFFQAAELR